MKSYSERERIRRDEILRDEMARDEIAREEIQEERWGHHARHTGLAVGLILLAVALVGLVWIAYPAFQRQDGSLADLRERVRLQLDSAGKRAAQAAGSAYDSLETRLNSRSTPATTQPVAAGPNPSVDADLSARVSNLEAARANLEAARASDESQIAELKQEVKEDTNALNQAGIEKIPFEAGRDRDTDLADGVSLHVSGTDPANARVSGWMWVAGDHRNVWLHQQNALDPVIFYGAHDNAKRELVITNVARNSVTGYLLMPKSSRSTASSAGGE